MKPLWVHPTQRMQKYYPYRARASSKATTSSSGVAQDVPMRAR